MKKLITYIMVLIIIFLFLMILKVIISKMSSGVSDDVEAQVDNKSAFFLKKVNFSAGDYTLYVNHEELGEFAVVDEKVLKANKNRLKLEFGWMNYVPGEADRSYGVLLFKDNKLVKSKQGAHFKTFELGNLQENAVAVTEHSYYGTKSEIQAKIDFLEQNDDSYITSKPEFNQVGEFTFWITFPAVALPVQRDSSTNEIISVNGIDYDKWSRSAENEFIQDMQTKIEKCIRSTSGNINNFELGSIGVPIFKIFLINSKENKPIKDKEDNLLYLNDYDFYQFQFSIRANKEDAEALSVLDYNKCITDQDRNKEGVITNINNLIKNSTTPNLSFEQGEVQLRNDIDTLYISGLDERHYSLKWLELK